jgi:Kdo2-lipid IVA lauroyltransferase/acyltransferase
MKPHSEPELTARDSGRSALWIRALSRLPLSVLYRLTALIVWLLRHGLRFRVAVARDNLRRCFPERTEADIESLLGDYYRQLAQVAAEFLKMPDLSADQLRTHLQLQNVERVNAETRAGRSVLLLGAHQCNWEWTLQATVLYLGVQIDAAYKPLHAAGFDRELRKLRCRYGAHLIAAKKLVREVVRRRGQLHAVALHADQMPASSGRRQWLTFLGRDTAFYPGPGEIARMTGYAAFFVQMRRLSRGQYQLDLLPICAAGERPDPQIFTARYASLVEAMIRANPADWTWIHRRWKASRPLEASSEPAAQTAAPKAGGSAR